jgi:hypothetical protein
MSKFFLKTLATSLRNIATLCDREADNPSEEVVINETTYILPELVYEPTVEVIGGKSKWSTFRRSTQFRTSDARGYVSWNNHEDYDLTEMFNCGTSMNGLASYHGRSLGAIKSRLTLLGLTDVFGNKL